MIRIANIREQLLTHLRMSSRNNKMSLTKGQKTLDCFFAARAASGDGSNNRTPANVTNKRTKRSRQDDSPEKQDEDKSRSNATKRHNKLSGLYKDEPIELLDDTLPAPASIGSTATSKPSSLSPASSDQMDSHHFVTTAPQRPPLRTHDGSKSPIKIIHKLPRLNIVDDPVPKLPQPRYIVVPKYKARTPQKGEPAMTQSESKNPKFAATSVKMMYGKMNKVDACDKDTAGKGIGRQEHGTVKQRSDTKGDIDSADATSIISGANSVSGKSSRKFHLSSKSKGVTRIILEQPKSTMGLPLAQMEKLRMNKSDLFSEDEQDENTDIIQPIVEHRSPTASQSIVLSPGKAVRAADSVVNKSPLSLQNGPTTTVSHRDLTSERNPLDVQMEENSCDSDDLFDNVTSPVKNTAMITSRESVPDMQHVKPRRDVLTLAVERFVENFESKPSANLLVGRVSRLDGVITEKNGQRDRETSLDMSGLMNKENAVGICSGDIVYVILGGSWLTERFEPNTEVSVFGWFRGPVCRVDSTHGGLVVSRPDELLTATTISSSFFCPRKALLQQKFRKLEGLNSNMLVGTVVHEVFQRAVSEKLQRSEIVAVTDEILSRSSILHDICLLGSAPHEIKAHVLQMVPHILSFIRGNCPGGRKDFRVREVVDIEENLWCPRLGVKGKVDMTVELEMAAGKSVVSQLHAKMTARRAVKRLRERRTPVETLEAAMDLTPRRSAPSSNTFQRRPLLLAISLASSALCEAPLELKTGKPSFSREHNAQVLLYTLMMNEKTGAEQRSVLPDNSKTGGVTRDSLQDASCGEGVLTYIQRGADSALVKADKGSLQGLMQHRNHLADAWWSMQNPEVDGNTIRMRPGAVGQFKEEERFCGNCNANVACSLYARMSGDLPEGSVRSEVATKVLGHLSEKDLSYTWHWLMLLDMECVENSRRNPQAFWKYSVESRVKNGTCAADLRVANIPMKTSQGTNVNGQRDNGHIDNEISSTGNYVRLEGPPGSAISLTPGMYIALSEQDTIPRRVATKLGFVHAVDGNAIYLDLNLDPSESKTLLNLSKKYVVDVVNTSSAFGAAYANLIRLLEPAQSRLREMILGATEPAFEPVHPRADVELCMDILTELNDSQVRAVIRLLTARDYLLLQGMPGTGKTTVIVAIIRVLVRLGQRVLITSNTHNALDNVLEKLVKYDVDFVRMGKTSHPIVRQKTNEVQLADATCVAQVKEFYARQRVFGSTCLGTAHSVFERERFDVCIVDEASQVLQPVCLGPLMLAKRFLLVGDPKQLPPVIQSKEASRLGLEECLFKRLQRDNGSNLTVLNRQYRMNTEIMALCNKLVYEGELTCGNDEVAGQTLRSADEIDSNVADQNAPLNAWTQRCISTELSDSVVFVDTNGVSEQESTSVAGGLSNPGESQLLCRIVRLFTDRGVAMANIGVITPFRRQVLQLKSDLPLGVEVSTVDRYQGKEKDVILFSCVRTQPSANMDQEIMNDVRRLNVAVSRARRKLILVGAREAVTGYPSWARLLNTFRPEQFVTVQDGNS